MGFTKVLFSDTILLGESYLWLKNENKKEKRVKNVHIG